MYIFCGISRTKLLGGVLTQKDDANRLQINNSSSQKLYLRLGGRGREIAWKSIVNIKNLGECGASRHRSYSRYLRWYNKIVLFMKICFKLFSFNHRKCYESIFAELQSVIESQITSE